MAASDPSYFADFEYVKIFSIHFADLKQVKKLIVILLTLSISKNFSSYFAAFEQVKKVSGQFADFDQVKKIVVILQTLNNNYRFMNFFIILILYTI